MKTGLSLKLSYNAPVTLTFALLCLLAMGLNALTGGLAAVHLFQVYRCPITPLAVFRLFGHVLGHASWEHFLSNIGLLIVLGTGLEDRCGSRALLCAIVLTAFVSGLIQYVFFPGTALMGASGVVFMMVLLSAFGGMKAGTIPVTLIFVFLFYLVPELGSSIFIRDNVSHLAHIIGGLCGTVIGFQSGNRPRSA